MTRIIVKVLLFDEYNLEHIKKHNVSKEEIEAFGGQFLYHRRTHSKRYLAVGRVAREILLSNRSRCKQKRKEGYI